MVQNWAFAADILASKVSSEFSTLFIRSLDAQFGDLTSTPYRSPADQMVDAIALAVAAAQEAPELVATYAIKAAQGALLLVSCALFQVLRGKESKEILPSQPFSLKPIEVPINALSDPCWCGRQHWQD
jgi:hypothetical protein